MLVVDSGADEQLGVDRDRPAEVDEQSPGHAGEPVPRCEQAARLVERGRHESTVNEARPALVTVVELDVRLVFADPLGLGLAQVDAERVVAATPAGRIMMRRDREPLGRIVQGEVALIEKPAFPFGGTNVPYTNDIGSASMPLRELATKPSRVSAGPRARDAP